MSARHQLRVLGSVLTSTVAGWRGAGTRRARAVQPARRPVLYDMEGCPFCRLVREALTVLHLDVEIRPCPRRGTRFRSEAEQLGGRQQFPLLLDPNNGTVLYESADIVDYLFKTYGDGHPVPSRYRIGALEKAASMAASLTRGLSTGIMARPSRPAEEPLRLWSFEASPYSRLVRERLCELELPYTLFNMGKEQTADIGPAVLRLKPGPYVPKPGGKRERFFAEHGRMQVPYLEDPNTGAKLFESEAILNYLDQTYAG